jgi:1-acyl-sn-glycerol-3-phosphate acyltransferase
MIRMVVLGVAAFFFLFVYFMPLCLYAWITGRTGVIYREGQRGCRWALWIAGVRLEFFGLEKIPTDHAVVFMANHQSMVDPPALLGFMPPVLVMLKRTLFWIPALGWAMAMRGFVPIEREHRERAMHAVEQAVAELKAGHSFLVYPEGTRTPDGRLLPFKRGAFVMAVRAQVPIVPISVSGAYKIMRKGQFTLHPGTVRITFHDPVPTEGLDLNDRTAIIEKVRSSIAAGLSDEEKPLQTPRQDPQ